MSRLPRNLPKLSLTPALAAFIVALISLVVFLPALQNGFAGSWDDDTNLINNPYFRGLGLDHLRWMWTNHLMQHYVPLVWMTFRLDYLLWKDDPFGFHLTNVVLHAVNVGLFCLLALAILRICNHEEPAGGKTRPLAASVFAALFFGLHPLRVESVAWITERRDVLSGLFYILALLAYLRPFGNQPRSEGRRRLWMPFIFFVASVLSKEIAVTLPVVLLILDVYPLRRLGNAPGRWFGPAVRGVWAEKIPFFVVGLADGAMTIYVAVRHHLPDSFAALGWMPRLAVSVYGMAFYVLKTLVPLHLSPLYPLTPYKTSLRAAPFLISLTFVLVVSIVTFAFRRRLPGLLAVWIAYAVMLLPVGGLIHNGNQITADRYSYLSCLGWALVAGAGMQMWSRAVLSAPARASAGTILALVTITFLGWQTRTQIGVWRDARTLWGRAVSIEPSAVALSNLGTALFEEGDLLGAVERYHQAIAINPGYAPAHNNLGGALSDLHQFDQAIGEFRTVEKLVPGAPEPYNGIGNALLMQGKIAEAIAQYRRALQIRPDYPGARKNLEQALALTQNQLRTDP